MDVETHVTEGDMEDPELCFFWFLFSFFAHLILLAYFNFIYLQIKPRQPIAICYLNSAHRKVRDWHIYVLLRIYHLPYCG